MTDEFVDADFDEPTEDIEVEKRGTLMRELESWERVIDGLKMAADGARHMARYGLPDKWNRFAEYLDEIKRAVIRDGGFDRPADAKTSAVVWGAQGVPIMECCRRIDSGLKIAAAGADQIAVYQRLDVRWVRYASMFRTLADIEKKLGIETVRRITDYGWRNNHSGVLVPARLH